MEGELVIDIRLEAIVPMREVLRCLPLRPSGKCVHIGAIYRCTQWGIRSAALAATRSQPAQVVGIRPRS